MTPGVGGILPREVLQGGIHVDGRSFPAGIDIGVPIYAVQHNDAYYLRPFDFIPERWILDSSAEPNTKESVALGSAASVALARSAFCAFSSGPWSCAGKGMAYKEVSLAIARLVWLFEWRIAEGTHAGEGNPALAERSLRNRVNELQGKDRFVLCTDGPIVQFKSRNRHTRNNNGMI